MNTIAKRLIAISEVEIEYHSGTNEYGDGVISLNRADGTAADIALKRTLGRPIFKHASLYHELGHAIADMYGVNDYKETEKLFGDFDDEYSGTAALLGSAILFDHEDYITRYAQTHPEEDWADTFAYVVENYSSIKGKPKTLLEKKLHYVKQWISEILAGE